MKRIMVMIITVLLIGLAGVEASAAKKVAVVVEGNISKEQKSVVNSAVMSRLSGNKDYKAFERNDAFLRALEREHDFQLSGQVPESQIREIGERTGADYVIVVNAVVSQDDQCHMSGRMIDLVSGEVLKTCNASREYEDSSTLTALANNVAYRLISKKSK